MTEILANKPEMVVMASVTSTGMLVCLYHRELCLMFVLYSHGMWFGLENILTSLTGNSSLLACIPSQVIRSDVLE